MTVDYLTFNTKINWLNEGARIISTAVSFGTNHRRGCVNPQSYETRTIFSDFKRFLKNELDKDPRVVYNDETKQ